MIREGAIRIPFRYAAGTGGTRFLSVLCDEGRILAGRCRACGHTAVPLKIYCARCGTSDIDEIAVGPEGDLVSWTRRDDGRAFGLIRFDGAGATLLHRMLFEPGADSSARRVRLRLRPRGERVGAILDIEGIEPAQGGTP